MNTAGKHPYYARLPVRRLPSRAHTTTAALRAHCRTFTLLPHYPHTTHTRALPSLRTGLAAASGIYTRLPHRHARPHVYCTASYCLPIGGDDSCNAYRMPRVHSRGPAQQDAQHSHRTAMAVLPTFCCWFRFFFCFVPAYTRCPFPHIYLCLHTTHTTFAFAVTTLPPFCTCMHLLLLRHAVCLLRHYYPTLHLHTPSLYIPCTHVMPTLSLPAPYLFCLLHVFPAPTMVPHTTPHPTLTHAPPTPQFPHTGHTHPCPFPGC